MHYEWEFFFIEGLKIENCTWSNFGMATNFSQYKCLIATIFVNVWSRLIKEVKRSNTHVDVDATRDKR